MFVIFIILILLIVLLLFDFRSICKLDKIKLSSQKSHIIISLTTTPDRIDDAKYSISSLLNGSILPQKIIFNLPYVSMKGKEYTIPDWLKKMKQDYEEILYINRCEDYGPATKIIPTLLLYKDYPEQKIIYLDDDQIYPINYLKNFLRDYKDENSVLARWGYNVKTFKKICKNKICGKLFKYKFHIIFFTLIIVSILVGYTYGFKSTLFFWNILLISILVFFISMYKIKEKDIVMGCKGVLVKPKFFNLEQLLNYSKYPKEVLFHDDIYLSGHLRENGIKCIIKGEKVTIPIINKNYFNSLHFTDNFDESNRCISIDCFKW